METRNPTSVPPSPQGEASASLAPDSTSPGSPWFSKPSTALRFWTLGAGLGATLISWLLIEITHDTFKPKGTAAQFMNTTFLIPGAAERARADTRNAALAMGLTGAAMGLAFGLAGGLLRRSISTAGIAAFVGLVVGAASACGTTLASVPLASRLQQRDPGNSSIEMASSLIVHGLPWAAMGAVGGLAFGIGQGNRQAFRGLLGGLVGAVGGVFLYEIIVALALPGSKLTDPVALTWQVRLLAQAVAVMSVAVGIASLCARPQARTP